MSRYISVILILVALISLVWNRFRLLNYILSIPQLRELAVSMALRIPFFRNKMIPQPFQTHRS